MATACCPISPDSLAELFEDFRTTNKTQLKGKLLQCASEVSLRENCAIWITYDGRFIRCTNNELAQYKNWYGEWDVNM